MSRLPSTIIILSLRLYALMHTIPHVHYLPPTDSQYFQYCTISIDSAVTRHKASGFGRIPSPVPCHRWSGRGHLVDLLAVKKFSLEFEVLQAGLRKRHGRIFFNVTDPPQPGHMQNFVHGVTGHTPGRINQNGTVLRYMFLLLGLWPRPFPRTLFFYPEPIWHIYYSTQNMLHARSWS